MKEEFKEERLLKSLEELVLKKGKIELKETSEIFKLKLDEVEELLSELLEEGRIEGDFTLDGEYFITKKKLKEYIMRGLE